MAHSISLSARADLAEIWNYVAERSSSSEIANRLLEKFARSFLLLASQPHLGRNRGDEFGRQRRSFAVGEYVIVYRIQGSDVLILRVVHGRRDLDSIFGH